MTSAIWVVLSVKKHVSTSLLIVWVYCTVVASAVYPFAHLVRFRGFNRYWLPATADDPLPRKPPVATFADIPVSVSTQFVPSVGQSTVVVWADEQVPSAGPPGG